MFYFLPGYQAAQLSLSKTQTSAPRGFVLFASRAQAEMAANAINGILYDDHVVTADLAKHNLVLNQQEKAVWPQHAASSSQSRCPSGTGQCSDQPHRETTRLQFEL